MDSRQEEFLKQLAEVKGAQAEHSGKIKALHEKVNEGTQIQQKV